MKKNILFVAGRFGVGGVERVTVTLANEFVARGYGTCIAAFRFEQENMLHELDARVQHRELSFPAFTMSNLVRLRCLVRELGADVVINQWALPAPLALMLRIAMFGSRSNLITVEHNSPMMNAGGWARRSLVLANLYVVCLFSRHFVYLSSSLVLPLMRHNVIPNPVKISGCQGAPKEDVIVFVGRISIPDKRPDRLIDVWRCVCDRLPSWSLEIVGDGPDLPVVKRMAEGLPRVSFEGYQNPDSYYERAKILVQTSSAEGFGMVLVEAMAHGCVPVSHAAISTAREILGDSRAGLVVEGDWNSQRFANELARLAANESLLEKMAGRGSSVASLYSPDGVVRKYEALF